jgi:hypothetical protein
METGDLNMGKTFTPKYRAEYRDNSGRWNTITWNVTSRTNVTGHGAPTVENAERLRKALNKSFMSGGSNEHVSKAVGYVVHVNRLRVIHQATSQVVSETVAPLFEIT